MPDQNKIAAALVEGFEEVNSLARLFGDDPDIRAAEQKRRNDAYWAKKPSSFEVTVTCQVQALSPLAGFPLSGEPLRLEVLLYPSGRLEARQISELSPEARPSGIRPPIRSGRGGCDRRLG